MNPLIAVALLVVAVAIGVGATLMTLKFRGRQDRNTRLLGDIRGPWRWRG